MVVQLFHCRPRLIWRRFQSVSLRHLRIFLIKSHRFYHQNRRRRNNLPISHNQVTSNLRFLVSWRIKVSEGFGLLNSAYCHIPVDTTAYKHLEADLSFGNLPSMSSNKNLNANYCEGGKFYWKVALHGSFSTFKILILTSYMTLRFILLMLLRESTVWTIGFAGIGL